MPSSVSDNPTFIEDKDVDDDAIGIEGPNESPASFRRRAPWFMLFVEDGGERLSFLEIEEGWEFELKPIADSTTVAAVVDVSTDFFNTVSIPGDKEVADTKKKMKMKATFLNGNIFRLYVISRVIDFQ